MRIWLDTEFNGFKGDLISIGMVAEDGSFFYAVRDAVNSMSIHPWVAEHVMPYLTKRPDDIVQLFEDDTTIRFRLENYLHSWDEELEIISDWPEDVQLLNQFMIVSPGMMINTPKVIRYTVDRTIDGLSEIPHNAIYDAIGNMTFALTREYNQK